MNDHDVTFTVVNCGNANNTQCTYSIFIYFADKLIYFCLMILKSDKDFRPSVHGIAHGEVL